MCSALPYLSLLLSILVNPDLKRQLRLEGSFQIRVHCCCCIDLSKAKEHSKKTESAHLERLHVWFSVITVNVRATTVNYGPTSPSPGSLPALASYGIMFLCSGWPGYPVDRADDTLHARRLGRHNHVLGLMYILHGK